MVIDPASLRYKADVILYTNYAAPSELKFPPENERTFFGPGEYEVKGISINGFPAQDTTVYKVEMESIVLCFLGNLKTELPTEVLEQLSGIDILFTPASINPSVVKKIEPSIVIPSFAKDFKQFSKNLGYSSQTVEKLTIKKKDLGGENIKIIILKKT